MKKDTAQTDEKPIFISDEEKFESELVEKLALFYVALARSIKSPLPKPLSDIGLEKVQ